jgi:hypothetical protein
MFPIQAIAATPSAPDPTADACLGKLKLKIYLLMHAWLNPPALHSSEAVAWHAEPLPDLVELRVPAQPVGLLKRAQAGMMTVRQPVSARNMPLHLPRGWLQVARRHMTPETG